MSSNWFYTHADATLGPFSARQLRGFAASGQLLLTDRIWKEGTENRVLARNVGTLFPALPSAPAELQPPVTADQGTAASVPAEAAPISAALAGAAAGPETAAEA